MKVTYETTAVATCPVDGSTDVYTVTVVDGRTIPVERILDAIKEASADPVYQETFTEFLAADLGCTVTTVGWHSGVKTTVTA